MAYMSQEKKKQLAPAIKAVLAKYGVKGNLSVRHHSSLVLTLKSGKIDFEKDSVGEFHHQINHYWYHEHFKGKSKKFLGEAVKAMMAGNHDNSDIMTDYFDVGWYIDVNVGSYDKAYIVE